MKIVINAFLKLIIKQFIKRNDPHTSLLDYLNKYRVNDKIKVSDIQHAGFGSLENIQILLTEITTTKKIIINQAVQWRGHEEAFITSYTFFEMIPSLWDLGSMLDMLRDLRPILKDNKNIWFNPTDPNDALFPLYQKKCFDNVMAYLVVNGFVNEIGILGKRLHLETSRRDLPSVWNYLSFLLSKYGG